MKRNEAKVLAIVLSGGLLATSCVSSKSEGVPKDDAPATIEAISGSDLSRVIFSEEAMASVGIETTPVGNGKIKRSDRIAIPYASLLYDSRGGTWVYKRVEPRIFQRHKVTVDRIEDGTVYLIDGPDWGTEIVTKGAVQLFGAEFEVGH